MFCASVHILRQLEWLTSLPWPNTTPEPGSASVLSPIKDRSFLSKARSQLDADHFGLEKIKKRLIEYLAIVRLREMNAERERLENQNSGVKAEAESKRNNKNGKAGVKTDERALVPYKAPSPSDSSPSTSRLSNKKGVKGPILL